MLRRQIALTALLAVLASLTAVVTPVAGGAETERESRGAARPADRALDGYAIPRTRRAGSGFIGSRRLGRSTTVYRTDPRRVAPIGGFRSAGWSSSYPAAGGGPVGTRRTACAAQLLSRYGRTSSLDRLRRLQAAGVDVAVLHLLHGRGFRAGGVAQRRRTNQVAKGPTIRAFAQNLIEDFCRFSGPYAVTLTSDRTSVDVGEEITYGAGVRSRSGAPMSGVRVLFTVAAAPAVTTRTDDAGLASHTVTAGTAGPLSSNLVTHGLPEERVRVLRPRRTGASRVVVAGLHQGFATPRSLTIAVRARPLLALDPDRPVTAGAPFRLRFTIRDGYPGVRTAVLQVVGPLDTSGPGGASDCGDGRVIRRTTLAVDADAAYRSAPLTLHRTGVFLWRVTVPASTYNRPVVVCGGRFRVTR